MEENGENEDKQKMREVYQFKNQDAFENFFEGMCAAHSGDTPKSIEMFARAVELEPDNPSGYQFLVMSLEFDETSTEADRLKWVEAWVEVSAKSGRETQIFRSNISLEWYKMTPEERREKFKSREKKS